MKTWGITNAGLVRSENQDAYAVFQTGAFHAAVVCDGMGGTNGGRVASAIAVSRFEEELRSALRDDMTAAQVRQAMLSAIACANDAIRQEAARNAEYQHMGTTLVCAVTRPDMAIIGNIGDSRAYHITAEGIFQISRDHSVVENMVAKGDLTPQEARNHPNRNLITRALGPDINARADAFELSWQEDEFLLLCSDGLVNTVSDQEMLFEVLHDGDVNECLDHLLQISLQRGAPDNITAVLLLKGDDHMDQYIGKMLDDRYEILELIGTGGMANVYKARCHRLNRLVAIKILKSDLADNADFRRRFHDESQAVAQLSHANIVSVYDVSTNPDREYIVMELIDGITLKQYMERRGRMDWRESLHFITQIMRGLSHAHSRGIIHRDIKPQNIMVLRDGSVKVADFGIACLANAGQTLTQEALGSVHYISPEQARGDRIDAAPTSTPPVWCCMRCSQAACPLRATAPCPWLSST